MELNYYLSGVYNTYKEDTMAIQNLNIDCGLTLDTTIKCIPNSQRLLDSIPEKVLPFIVSLKERRYTDLEEIREFFDSTFLGRGDATIIGGSEHCLVSRVESELNADCNIYIIVADRMRDIRDSVEFLISKYVSRAFSYLAQRYIGDYGVLVFSPIKLVGEQFEVGENDESRIQYIKTMFNLGY